MRGVHVILRIEPRPCCATQQQTKAEQLVAGLNADLVITLAPSVGPRGEAHVRDSSSTLATAIYAKQPGHQGSL
jgi:hypothetical protein